MDDSQILVWVQPDPEDEGAVGVPRVEDFGERARDLGQGLGEIASDLREQLDASLEEGDSGGWGLDEVQLSFSLDLRATAGVLVAKGSAGAGFEATVTWRRRPGGG